MTSRQGRSAKTLASKLRGRKLVRDLAGFSKVLVATFAIVCLPQSAGAKEPEQQFRRFLLIYANQSTLPANIEVTRGIDDVLRRELGSAWEVYAEYRDVQRFPGPEEEASFKQHIARRYGEFAFDAVLTLGQSALTFAETNMDEILPDVPVVFGGFSAGQYETRDLPPRFHGVVTRYDARSTVNLARQLQPEATRLVVFSGNAPQDDIWKSAALEQFSGDDSLDFELVTDRTLAEFENYAASLSQDDILLYLTIFKDADGSDYIPAHAAENIAAAASVPTYGVYDSYLGTGVIGGVVDTFYDHGAAIAETALRVLDGEAVPALSVSTARTVIDWRQVERFGIDRDLIPSGTEIRFYTPSLWEQFRPQILLAAAIILAQSATIAALIVQNARRRRSEAELSRQRIEMAHLARLAQLSELSGALAHELNQPLTAILANAEAGVRLITRDEPDLREVAAILADIADDDRRAAGIISDLRCLMSKGTTEFAILNLNEVVTTTMRLAEIEFRRRGLTIDTRLARGPIVIRGNLAQLQQVLLNLMLNGAEAMESLGKSEMSLTVATRQRDDGMRELTVCDHGPGLAPDVDPFRPFATTKGLGMGLGLPICRTIAEVHGGELSLETTVVQGRNTGTRAVLVLPPP